MMSAHETLTDMRKKLCALMMEAHQRGDNPHADDLPPVYWNGVQFGLETAIDLLEVALTAED